MGPSGEEADIIVLSLVRNNTEGGGRGSIGFLKVNTRAICSRYLTNHSQSENRTNVALSRAKHGMIIMGNAELLASHSKMWKTVTDNLREARRLGPSLPISCYNHPDYVKYITEPETIPLFSPDGGDCHLHLLLLANRSLGGCLRPCSKRLDCGHSCPLKVSWANY